MDYLDQLREQAFSYIDQNDAEIEPVLEQFAQLIARMPDAAVNAPDKKHYLVRMLARVDSICRENHADPEGYESTLMELGFILVARLNPIDGAWPGQL